MARSVSTAASRARAAARKLTTVAADAPGARMARSTDRDQNRTRRSPLPDPLTTVTRDPRGSTFSNPRLRLRGGSYRKPVKTKMCTPQQAAGASCFIVLARTRIRNLVEIYRQGAKLQRRSAAVSVETYVCPIAGPVRAARNEAGPRSLRPVQQIH